VIVSFLHPFWFVKDFVKEGKNVPYELTSDHFMMWGTLGGLCGESISIKLKIDLNSFATQSATASISDCRSVCLTMIACSGSKAATKFYFDPEKSEKFTDLYQIQRTLTFLKIPGIFILLSSLGPIRRKMFEWFYYPHIFLFVAFYVFGSLHSGQFKR